MGRNGNHRKRNPTGVRPRAPRPCRTKQWAGGDCSGKLDGAAEETTVNCPESGGGSAYNFKVTFATKIQIDGKKAGFEDLDTMTNASISVTFVPTRQGNVAREMGR
jgi:hypothetical protein